MLYLLKSNDYLKIGYTSDEEMIHYKYSKYLSNNTEWFYIPDIKEQYKIILEFIFGVDVDTFEMNVGENAVNAINISNDFQVINIAYCNSEDYKSKHLIVAIDGCVLHTNDVQTFYTSYLDNGYSGIYVNHIILFEYRKIRKIDDPFGHITTDTNSPYLLDIIKPYF